MRVIAAGTFIMLAKLSVLIYLCIRYMQGGMENIAFAIFSILVYAFVNVISHIVKSKNLKLLFMFLSVILLAIFSVKLNILFILLIPANILELTFEINTQSKLWTTAVFLPLMLLKGEIFAGYLLVSMLLLVIFISLHSMKAKIRHLSEENDELREKLGELSQRLDRDREYARQFGYLLQLEERNSIAQKIHDRVGHVISGSIIQMEAASLLIKKDAEKAESIIQNVTNNLRDGMESIRSTLRNIKPPAEQLGINRLKAVLDEFSSKHGIKINLSYEGNLDNIIPVYWKVILDNTTEALTNSLKYSGCTGISAGIHVLNKVIKYEIKDNGAGAYSFKKGIGLLGIEERSASVGGKVIIDGSAGFSVITLLPIEGGS